MGKRRKKRGGNKILLLFLGVVIAGSIAVAESPLLNENREIKRVINQGKELIVSYTDKLLPRVNEGDSIYVVAKDNTVHKIAVTLDDSPAHKKTNQYGYKYVLEGKIIKVSDGDTVTLLDQKNRKHKIRLDGIDCPESDQAYGRKATTFVKERIDGKKVKIYFNKKDPYKRILGLVIGSKGENINELLLANGLAWHYKHFNKNPKYAQLEREAKAKRLNLWSDKNPIEPYQFRQMKKKKRGRVGAVN